MSESFADKILVGVIEKKSSLFKAKTANEWIEEAEKQPIPNMLCGELWHEGELCFLFADTNVGKSIFAVQIANAISKNESCSVFKTEAAKQKVLYFDFELSAKQFQKRYSINYRNPYRFDSNFIRFEIDTECNDILEFERNLSQSIERAIIEHAAKVIIIDNMTYLKMQSTDTAKEAIPVLKMLIDLKKKFHVSILALAHTPKRDQSKPITVNDLAGSKHFSNFADSIFSIGQSSKEPRLRYIKQIKTRATEKIYDSENVIVCEIDKQDNFLGLSFVEYDSEKTHLKELSDKERGELDNLIVQAYNDNPNLSERQIAGQLNTNHKRVGRVLRKNGLKE